MLTFDRKLYLGFCFLFAAILPFTGGIIYSMHTFIEEKNQLITTSAEDLLAAEKLRYLALTQGSEIRGFILSADQRSLDGFREAHDKFRQLLAQLQSHAKDSEDQNLLREIQTSDEHLHRTAAVGITMRQQSNSIRKTDRFFVENNRAVIDTITNALRAYTVKKTTHFETAQRVVEHASAKFLHSLVLASVVLFLIATGVGIVIVRTIQQKKILDQQKQNLFENEKSLSQARKETVDVVSHDLKNPLSVIKMSLNELLEQTNSSPFSAAEFRDVLKIGLRGADSMERLIHNLLDHAKIEAGRLTLEKEDWDFAVLTRNFLDQLKPLAASKGLHLRFRHKNELPFISCDRGRLEQVLSNLVGNAIKFSPEGSAIEVSVEFKDHQLLACVRDEGAGLSAEQLPKIFDRFWQVRSTAQLGTGLGLSIAKGIVEAHGGKIWVESEPGQGCRFYFTLMTAKIPSTPAKSAKTRGFNELYSLS